jgi:hypothetical protein
MKYLVTFQLRVDLNLQNRTGSAYFDDYDQARDYYDRLFRDPQICEAELLELQSIGSFQR